MFSAVGKSFNKRSLIQLEDPINRREREKQRLAQRKIISMKLYTINTGYFKLDGGAMFGVVPKSIWNKLNPADENNMCSWALRCLLIEDGERLILVDNGMGNKQDAKFFGHYFLHGDDTLETSLAKHGFGKDDITDAFLTHLHFDHCGGSIVREGDKLLPAFKNAVYWSNKDHWQWATVPNEREKASFLKENILPIKESGRLQFIDLPAAGNDGGLTGSAFTDNISIRFASGHTDKMMLPQIRYKGKTIVYMADLLPSAAHIPIPYIMAYDMFPLSSLKEKKSFLEEAVTQDFILYFEHDPLNECCSLQLTEKGIRPKELFRLEDL
jgi:glyoxylase-like metal-dependent hydrolase (beta-lactamase superfamily II)